MRKTIKIPESGPMYTLVTPNTNTEFVFGKELLEQIVHMRGVLDPDMPKNKRKKGIKLHK